MIEDGFQIAIVGVGVGSSGATTVSIGDLSPRPNSLWDQ